VQATSKKVKPEFDKYRKRGDYHWREFNAKTIYRQHVLHVLEWITEDNVLDIGAGDGLITHQLRLRGKDAVGIDNSPHGLAIAKRKGVPVSAGDAYDLPKARLFSAAFMGDVIEHLEFPGLAVAQAKQVLAPTGALYIVTPPQAHDGVIRDPHHYREYTPDELVDFMRALGFVATSQEVRREWYRMYVRFVRDDC